MNITQALKKVRIPKKTGLLLIVAISFTINFTRLRIKREAKEKARTTKSSCEKALLPYRTIYAGNGADSLLAYELRYEGVYYGMYTTYSAVIRNIDPSRDDYKRYCREVIRDIKKTTGMERIGVTIYDSYEAFYLAHTELQKRRFIDSNEAKFIAQHTLAIYNGDKDPGGDCYCSLAYYAEAGNGYYEKESFTP